MNTAPESMSVEELDRLELSHGHRLFDPGPGMRPLSMRVLIALARRAVDNEKLCADNARLRANAAEADGCFEAALAEGWLDALGNGDLDRIRHIWNWRISFARSLLQGT